VSWGFPLALTPREAIDDGLRLFAIVEAIKTSWAFCRRARFVGTRMIVLSNARGRDARGIRTAVFVAPIAKPEAELNRANVDQQRDLAVLDDNATTACGPTRTRDRCPAGPLTEVDLPCRRSEWHGSF